MAALRMGATGRRVLALLVAANVVYLVMILITIPRLERLAPDTPLFDLSPGGYSHQDAVALLDALGQEGRDAYLFPQLALDFAYPGAFAICYGLMLIWICTRRFPSRPRLVYIAWVPVLAGLCDYAENVLIIRMITRYPELGECLVAAASRLTVLKSVLTSVTFLLLLVGLATLVRRRPRPA